MIAKRGERVRITEAYREASPPRSTLAEALVGKEGIISDVREYKYTGPNPPYVEIDVDLIEHCPALERAGRYSDGYFLESLSLEWVEVLES